MIPLWSGPMGLPCYRTVRRKLVEISVKIHLNDDFEEESQSSVMIETSHSPSASTSHSNFLENSAKIHRNFLKIFGGKFSLTVSETLAPFLLAEAA